MATYGDGDGDNSAYDRYESDSIQVNVTRRPGPRKLDGGMISGMISSMISSMIGTYLV